MPLILLIEPLHQRRVVIDNCAGIHFLNTSHDLHGLLPGATGTHFQHFVQLVPGLFTAVNRAAVNRPQITGSLTKRAMKLELLDTRQKVAGIRGITGNMVLGTRIEGLRRAINR